MGPLFIDWTAYRAAFETEASRILGHPVHVRGIADAKLLPYPSLSFTDVMIGENAAAPLMTVGEFNMEIELFPLLSGEFHVTEMRVIDPELNVRIAADGTVEWIPAEARPAIDPGKVTLSAVDIERGRITIADARRKEPLVFSDIDARLDARSLVGPYKIEGNVTAGGDSYAIKAGTGSDDGSGRIPLKASVTPARRAVALTLDGALFSRDRRPSWTGKALLSRVIAKDDRDSLPWSVAADVEFTSAQLLAKSLEVKYGAEDRPFSVTGAATLSLDGTPEFESVLSARQIDLDRTLGKGPDAPVDLSGALSALASSLSDLPVPPIDGRVGFDIPGVVVGGSIISDLRLDVTTAGSSGWQVETLEATLPGHSRLTARGRVTTLAPVAFSGDVTLASEQPSTLVAWWYPSRSKLTLDPFDLKSGMTASREGLSLNDMTLSLKDGRVAGNVEFLPGAGDRKSRLNLALDADRLDASQIQAVAGLFSGGSGDSGRSGPDVVIQAAVGTLVAGDALAEGLDVSASLVDSTLDVDRFFVRSLAGARVTAAGTVRNITSTADGSLQLRVSAERMDGIADLARAFWPNAPAAAMLRSAAPFLSPVNVEATVLAKAAGKGTDIKVDARGNASATNLSGTLAFSGSLDAWDEAETSLDFSVEGPDGAALMRQFGLALPAGLKTDAGAGSLSISAMGRSREGLALVTKARMGPTEISLNGSATLRRDAPAVAELDLALKSPDVGPLLTLSGHVLQGVLASTPADVEAHLSVSNGKVAVADLKGQAADTPLSGAFTIDYGPEIPLVAGNLSIDEASLAALAEAALGPGSLDFPLIGGRSPWPEAPFGPALLDGFDTDLALGFSSLTVTDSLAAHQVKLALRSTASGTAFDGIAGEFAGGSFGGNLVIKRDLDGTAGISGTLHLKDAAADELVWRRDDRPAVTGSLGVELQVNASGRTVAGWMSSLTGGGSFSVSQGAIRSMNLGAFPSVIRLADGGSVDDARIAKVFTDNLDMGDLAFDRIDATYAMAGGTLRAPSILVAGAAGNTTGSATVDLARQTLQSEWRLAANPADAGVDGGAAPQVALVFSGPLANPSRKIDFTALSSFLGIRALEQETQRVLHMQADILERELLSREVLRNKEAAERLARAESDYKAQTIAEAEARKALEEAARKAAEEAAKAQRKAAAQKPPAGENDDFANQILEQLRRNQPKSASGQLDPLPQTEIAPVP